MRYRSGGTAMPSTIGRSAFSCSSGEKARMVPALRPETTIQITVKSSHSFLQGIGNSGSVPELGADAADAGELVVRALGVGLGLLARLVDGVALEERRRADARLEALFLLG